jgi:hypothetical protein
MTRAKSLGLTGFSFWAMDFLYLHAGGSARADAIQAFQFGPPPPPPPPAVKRISTYGWVNLRDSDLADVGDVVANGIPVRAETDTHYIIDARIAKSVAHEI